MNLRGGRPLKGQPHNEQPRMTEQPAGEAPRSSWGKRMLNGALWMIALRWAIRLTGLVSTVILARLLLPRDFGIVAFGGGSGLDTGKVLAFQLQ